MATSVNYIHSDADLGAYGLFNKFVARITSSVSGVSGYRIRVTYLQGSSLTAIRVVTPISDVANVNLQPLIASKFFKYEYSGQNNTTVQGNYSNVRIEIGEVTGDPPTFQGYDTNDEFWFYYGYTPDNLTPNYRQPNLYDTTPYGLPKVQKNLYLLEGDTEMLASFFDLETDANGTLNPANVITEFYNSAGALISTDTDSLGFLGSDKGYRLFDINAKSQLYDGTTAYAKVYVEYQDAGSGVYNSEELTLYPDICNPKYDHYRLGWCNRYGADEYLNFKGRATKTIRTQSGKVIKSDNIDYEASTAATIVDETLPEKTEYGKSYDVEFTLRSDFFNQEQLDALEDLYKSPNVYMFTPDYDKSTGEGLFPVILTDNNYEVQDVSNGVKKVSVTVQLANYQPIQT